MTIVMMCAVGLGVVALWTALWPKFSPDSKRAVFVYAAAYVMTYAIGAVIIGLSGDDLVSSYIQSGLAIPDAAGDVPLRYWLLVLGPLAIPLPLVAILQRRRRSIPKPRHRFEPGMGQFFLLGASVVGVLAVLLQGTNILSFYRGDFSELYGDYSGIVDSRLQLFDSVNGQAFGLIYSALPALSHVALFNARNRRSKAWMVMFVAWTALTAWCLAGTYQLAPLAVFVIALVLSAEQLGYFTLNARRAFFVIGGLFGMILVANAVKSGRFDLLDAMSAFIFRMPLAFPFWITAFPDSIPFSGIDWTGPLFGRGPDPGNSFVIAQYMYPRSPLGSAMTAPAHVSAYAQGGLMYSIVMMIVIGLIVAGVSRLRGIAGSSSVWHAMYIQSLVMLYYLTQSSLRGAIWDSYGLYWSIVVLAALSMISLTGRAARGRAPVPAIAPRRARPSQQLPAVASARPAVS
jgi:hypothetical protein